jgi:aryl-alcohol dehydrogenase-like predicted oxidoreductase
MRFALGTANFGQSYGVANNTGQVNRTIAHSIMRRSQEFGWDMLDTAIAYGESEIVIGEFGVNNWKVISKLPPVPEECPDVSGWVRETTLNSFRRLGIKKLYGLLLHKPGQLNCYNGGDLYKSLLDLKAQGLVEKIGVSIYNPEELDNLWRKYRFDLVQAPLNLIDRRLLESGWAERLKRSETEIHVRSVFLQGLLLLPPERRPPKFARWSSIWKEWDAWLNKTGLTPIQACLRFASFTTEIDRVVVGTDSISQIEEIVGAVDGYLPSFPNFGGLADERLINPTYWNQL